MHQERQRPLLATLLPHALLLEPRREEDEAIHFDSLGAREPETLASVELLLLREMRRESRERGEVDARRWSAFIG